MGSLVRFPSYLSSVKIFLRHFSSASSPAIDGSLGFLSRRDGGPAGESIAYRWSMLRRPETVVRPWKASRNSCNFIGTVVSPVKRYASGNGVYTCLEVNRHSRDSDSSPLRIFLVMKDKLAEISLQHLKPNDFVYVSGRLGSFEKADGSGNREICYKVSVRDLNYVKCNDQNLSSQKPASSSTDEITVPASSALDQQRAPLSSALDHEEKCRDRLYLWQVFFANPFEWWDNRQMQTPRRPDFKHKDTGECLWLNPDDPPWVRKQLQLYDSRMQGGHHRGGGRSHEWNLKDLEKLC